MSAQPQFPLRLLCSNFFYVSFPRVFQRVILGSITSGSPVSPGDCGATGLQIVISGSPAIPGDCGATGPRMPNLGSIISGSYGAPDSDSSWATVLKKLGYGAALIATW